MSKLRILTVLALGLGGVSLAQAQRIAPGLWEHATTMKTASGQMEAAMAQAQRDMANLPPEQRKMMQDMMARQGMSMGPQGTTMKLCITKAQAERDELPSSDGRCKHDSIQRSGNTVKVKFSCSGREASHGEGEYTMNGDKAYTGRTVVNSTVNGKPERMDMTVSAKWLSADCGSVKPAP